MANRDAVKAIVNDLFERISILAETGEGEPTLEQKALITEVMAHVSGTVLSVVTDEHLKEWWAFTLEIRQKVLADQGGVLFTDYNGLADMCVLAARDGAIAHRDGRKPS